ncbi:uncharacterized protein TNCV_4522671 [Trichonephila clavipes]|nr:uncharacterized protein TNCV_4522671 [Trichonephila clavipes]
MLSDVTEFVVGDIGKLFDGTRKNTEAKHEKWAKYYNRRRRDVRIRINDWFLVQTQPLSSAAKKVVAKFRPKFEGSYRVLKVRKNNFAVWKVRKRLTVNIDQVRLYHQRKSDDNGIRVGNSNSSGSRKSGERKQLWQNKIQAGTICGQREQKELSPEHPVNRLNTIREPVRSRGRRVSQSTPYYKDQGCKQQSTSQSREEIKRGSLSCQNSRHRGAQLQQRQEIGGKSTSRK